MGKKGKKVGKYDVPLFAASTSVDRALEKLRDIRPRVTKEDQEKINLEIRDLKEARKFIWFGCHILRHKRSLSKKRK